MLGMHFWPKGKLRESDQKVNDRLSIADREPGIPDSGPERIHGRGKQNMQRSAFLFTPMIWYTFPNANADYDLRFTAFPIPSTTDPGNHWITIGLQFAATR